MCTHAGLASPNYRASSLQAVHLETTLAPLSAHLSTRTPRVVESSSNDTSNSLRNIWSTERLLLGTKQIGFSRVRVLAIFVDRTFNELFHLFIF
jgi:hypothetical protein